MALLNNSCFCCSLETGVIIIGIFGGIYIIVRPAILSNSDKGSSLLTFLYKCNFNSQIVLNDNSTSNNHVPNTVYDPSDFIQSRIPSSGKDVLTFVSIIGNVLLIVGIIKKNRCYLLPWLVMGVIENLVGSLLVCGLLGFLTFDPDFRTHYNIYFTISMLLVCVVWWYTWLIVCSYYKELRQIRRVPSLNTESEFNIPPAYLKDEQTIISVSQTLKCEQSLAP